MGSDPLQSFSPQIQWDKQTTGRIWAVCVCGGGAAWLLLCGNGLGLSEAPLDGVGRHTVQWEKPTV